MSVIPPETIDRVRDETDIVELIKEKVELKRNGSAFKGLCPFHTEKTPSFTVTPDKGIYYCYGCGATGDSIKWLQQSGEYTFPQAIKFLGEKLGITIEAAPDHSLQPPRTAKPKSSKTLEEPPPKQSDIRAVASDSSNRLLGKCPSALDKMIEKKGWGRNTIACLAANEYLGVNAEDKLLYIYPNGIKARYDYDISRGDRWVIGKAKGNLWRGQELEHELIENVFVTEGETDLITLMSHRPEGLNDAYIAIPGSSNAKIDPVLAYKLGSNRKVYILFDRDDAGENATWELFEVLSKEASNCEVYIFDWDLHPDMIPKDAGDIGELPVDTIKSIDKFFKKL